MASAAPSCAEFLIGPADRHGLNAVVHGVRYPQAALGELAAAGILYRGWLPNHEVPATFARARATVHVPRRPYVEALPGIPTIRVFEALACGIPLVSAPWRDVEGFCSRRAPSCRPVTERRWLGICAPCWTMPRCAAS